MYSKTFLLWFDHFLDSWAEICQIFRWFFGKFKKSKRHSEIIWPLGVNECKYVFYLNFLKFPNLYFKISLNLQTILEFTFSTLRIFHHLVIFSRSTLQIFIVILLCKSIKVMRVIYNLMIENFFCKVHHWNPGIAKQLSKSSESKSQCWPELLSVCNRF